MDSEKQKERERKAAKVIAESGFKARDIGLSAQKKILSKMAGTSMSRLFIDENTSNILDHLYVIAKIYTNDKKESEKLIKNIIKTVIKFALLFRNENFEDEQKMRIMRLKGQIKVLAMNIMTFHEMDFTYDRAYMSQCLSECHAGVLSIAQVHFTPRTVARINRVFGFFNNDNFLDQVFNPDSEYRDYLSVLVSHLHVAIEKKVFG